MSEIQENPPEIVFSGISVKKLPKLFEAEQKDF